MTTYLLDANVFMAASRLHYGLDFCPAFWEWLIVNNKNDRVFSIERISDEVQAGNDALAQWASERGPDFFLKPDAALQPALGEVAQWATGQQYEPAAISTFFQVADTDLCKWMDTNGSLATLRHGFKCYGRTLRIAFFKAAHKLNPELEARYAANRLGLTRQLHYAPKSEKSLDVTLSLNGIPVVTLELKNPLTGQTLQDAVRQYRRDRDPRELIFEFKRRALVHFAVDTEAVRMTTRLAGNATHFLPFDKGCEGGGGNPADPAGRAYRTAYLWEEVLARNSLLDILARFTNEYNWGDFKGDPDKLMQRYFDAHVYVANWITAIFMVRLPMEALTRETAKAAAVPYLLDIKPTKTHWIITWSLEESENYDRFGMEDGRGWMARLVPVRDELLRGDLRSLYIGWLAVMAGEMMDDDEMEPLSVGGLASLTAAQQALAEFLEVAPDLLAGAGMGSPAAQETEVSRREMDKWIDALPRDEVNPILKQLLEGKG